MAGEITDFGPAAFVKPRKLCNFKVGFGAEGLTQILEGFDAVAGGGHCRPMTTGWLTVGAAALFC